MPDEPNKKMDETLRAYANERRKTPEVVLHPATRKMLQGEVSRVFGKASGPEPWWKKLRAFWPQIAFGGGLCLVFGIALLTLRSPDRVSQPDTTDTKREAASESLGLPSAELSELPDESVQAVRPAQQSAGAPIVAEPPALNSTLPPAQEMERTVSSMPVRQEKRTSRDALKPDAQLAAPQRGAVTDTSSGLAPEEPAETLLKAEGVSAAATPQVESQRSGGDARLRNTASRVVAAPAPVRLQSSEPFSRASELTNLGAARRLNFTQVSNSAVRAMVGRSNTLPVLTTFQFEQTGNSVRLLDRDGSIYLGRLEPAEDAVSAEAEVAIQQQPPLNNSTTYFFRAEGTNKTLGADLVVTGNYFARTNSAPSALDTFTISPEAKTLPQNQARHLIIGNAVIGSTNLPVQAVSNEQ